MKRMIFLLFMSLTLPILSQVKYHPYGGCFTPKGDLRSIVLFVGFGSVDSLNPIAV